MGFYSDRAGYLHGCVMFRRPIGAGKTGLSPGCFLVILGTMSLDASVVLRQAGMNSIVRLSLHFLRLSLERRW
jgi:hypothetical protein